MAGPALWLPSGAQTQIDAAALRKALFAKKLPWSEKYRTYYGSGLDLERIEGALRLAEDGIMVDMADLSREAIRNDPHVNGIAPKRFGALRALDYTITPAIGPGLDKKIATEIADDIRSKVKKIRGFRQALLDLAWGLFDARAALEIDWQWEGGRSPYTPAALDWIHPRRLGFGPDRELRVIETFLRVGWFEPVGCALRDIPGKFISWMPRYYNDYPEREGLAARTIYWTYFKRFSAKMRMVLTELFALPWRSLEADKDAPVQKEDMDEAADLAEQLGAETTAGFPPGIKLKIHWPGENDGELMNLTIDGVDSQMSRLWLGNEATTVAKGGALGSDTGTTAKGEQNIYLHMDGAGISERIQIDLIDVLVLLNYGPDWLPYAPVFELKTQPEKDKNAEQERYNKAISIGVPVPLKDYYEAVGIRPPEDGEAVIVLVERPIGQGGLPRTKIVDPSNETGLDEVNREAPPPEAPPGTSPEAVTGGEEDEDLDEEEQELGKGLGLERFGIVLEKQPDLGNGSPEVIIERGTREGARHTSGWAALMIASVEGLTRETTIYNALKRTAGTLPLEALAASIERTLVRGLMLGALDAAWEAEADEPVPIPILSERDGILLAGLGGGVPDFVKKPFQEAIAFFTSKKVLTRKAFDRLRADAKRRAFTVAGLARKAMLQTAHDALSATIRDGLDIRGFAKALNARFDSAGWTRLKPSHVELVYRNGSMGAYATGRDQQMTQPEVLAARPYWQILGVDDSRTRTPHGKAHKKVLRADDSFWKRAPLPWGHNCRCRKISRSERDLKRLGLTVVSGSELAGVPDKGWDAGSLLA